MHKQRLMPMSLLVNCIIMVRLFSCSHFVLSPPPSHTWLAMGCPLSRAAAPPPTWCLLPPCEAGDTDQRQGSSVRFAAWQLAILAATLGAELLGYDRIGTAAREHLAAWQPGCVVAMCRPHYRRRRHGARAEAAWPLNTVAARRGASVPACSLGRPLPSLLRHGARAVFASLLTRALLQRAGTTTISRALIGVESRFPLACNLCGGRRPEIVVNKWCKSKSGLSWPTFSRTEPAHFCLKR